MQVDTRQLREAAATLRADVIKPLQQALDLSHGVPSGSFDSYTTDAPFDEARRNWHGEVDTIRQAAWELADKFEAVADEYDKADTQAAQRLTATR
jgi:hypothetical protein